MYRWAMERGVDRQALVEQIMAERGLTWQGMSRQEARGLAEDVPYLSSEDQELLAVQFKLIAESGLPWTEAWRQAQTELGDHTWSDAGVLSSPRKLAIAGFVMISVSWVPILTAFPSLAMSNGSFASSDGFRTTVLLPFVALLGLGTYLIVAAAIWHIARHFRT
jgi:hypothetical protein